MAAIRASMQQEGVYGDLFPAYFSPSPYDESLAGYHFLLLPETQRTLGFRVKNQKEDIPAGILSSELLPDYDGELHSIQCAKCSRAFDSHFPPNHGDKIVCESCYREI